MHDKSIGPSDDEQWEVVEKTYDAGRDCSHLWSIVQLRNRAGRLSAGVICKTCGHIVPVPKTQLTRYGSTPARPKE